MWHFKASTTWPPHPGYTYPEKLEYPWRVAPPYNDRPDMHLSGRPDWAPPGSVFRALLSAGDQEVDELNRRVQGFATDVPTWEYEVFWFVWELLRRSYCRFAHFNQGWWLWERSFPPPRRDGTAPPEHAEVARCLMNWLTPRAPYPFLVLPRSSDQGGRDARWRFDIAPGGPHVELHLDLRARDLDVIAALDVLRRARGVEPARRCMPHAFWGDFLSPVEAIELWGRHRAGEEITALARERLESDPTRSTRARLRAHDPELQARRRSLHDLFRRIDDAIVEDPLRPFAWKQ